MYRKHQDYSFFFDCSSTEQCTSFGEGTLGVPGLLKHFRLPFMWSPSGNFTGRRTVGSRKVIEEDCLPWHLNQPSLHLCQDSHLCHPEKTIPLSW